MTWTLFVLLGLTLCVGAFVQSVVGFGLAVVGAPFIVVFAPELMPAALLVASLTLPSWELLSGPKDIAWRPWRYAVVGRLLMMPAGVWLVAHASASLIAVVVGVMVLIAVAASIWAIQIRPEPGPALLAGLLTGISGTAASIGGPFLALVLQKERPARIRSTLALFFVVGALSSVLALAAAGQVTWQQVLVGLGWFPFIAVGHLVAVSRRDHLDAERMRHAVLAVATVAGIAVIVRSVLA